MTRTGEYVVNTKTNTKGEVVCRYNRTNDGKAIVQVETVHGRVAYWLAAHVEVA